MQYSVESGPLDNSFEVHQLRRSYLGFCAVNARPFSDENDGAIRVANGDYSDSDSSDGDEN